MLPKIWELWPPHWKMYRCKPGIVIQGARHRIKATVIEFKALLDASLPFHPRSISVGCTSFLWLLEVRGEIGEHVAYCEHRRTLFAPCPSPAKLVKWLAAAAVREFDGRGFECGLLRELKFIMPSQGITLESLKLYSGLREKQPAYDYSLPWE